MKKFIILIGAFLCITQVFAKDLRDALKEAAKQFSSSLEERSVVAIIGIYSESSDLSDFMLDELTAQLIKCRMLTIADRVNLEAIKKEMSFQLSGEVGDESIQQLGAKIGAETVIQGVLKEYGGIYNLTIRALNVTTAAIPDMYRMDVELGEVEMAILAKNAKRKLKPSPVMIGFQNMCFGLGSYLNGRYGDGVFLTITHALAWSFLGTGLHLSLSGESYVHLYTGVILLSLAPAVWLTAIIYGAVRPHYYNDSASIIATVNKSGFRLDLVATSKKNIAPQISYIFRY